MCVERVLIASNASANVILLRLVHVIKSGGDDKVDWGTRRENVGHELQTSGIKSGK